MSKEYLKFKISSALKDLIGKDLITDQFIAIFELVKNSFDAHASHVTLIFENIYGNNPRIIIKDNGKGMDYDDIENKWLFVAYSAKRDGSEDEQLEKEQEDYRDKINNKRVYAGAKGVGRFSCDRLGSKLNLVTIKNKQGALIENIQVNWEDFERNIQEEFINVGVEHRVLEEHSYDIEHGTVLEITELRDNWQRDDLLILKKSLEKLINPNQVDNKSNFQIEIIVEEEREKDKIEVENLLKKERKKAKVENRDFDLENLERQIHLVQVNGLVKNTIFERLEIKTTQIITRASSDGRYIETILKDRGTLIYKIKEKNIYSIENIVIHLFYLNRVAKTNFSRLMGFAPIDYGSVFMYKNGFRIYPFGESGEDVFKIDARKTQGYARYLGTRDLIGRIEINGDNDQFKETTSRDGGLVKNTSYKQLEEFFLEKALKRLEKYVVDVIDWGIAPGTSDEEITPLEIKSKIMDFIKKLTHTNQLLSIEYDENFLEVIEKKQEKSVIKTIDEIKEIAIKEKDPVLLKKVNSIDGQFKQVIQAKSEIEKEIVQKTEVLRAVQEELVQKTNQNLFLKSVTTLDFDNIVSLHHQIGIYASDIDTQILLLSRKLNRGFEINSGEIRSFVEGVSLLNQKILAVSKFATKANFNLQSETMENDLIVFIEDYINNIYNLLADNSINIELINNTSNGYVVKFKPIEITIIIDNLINNARKASGRNITITLIEKDSKLQIRFRDDGKGLNKQIENKNEIFEKGYTTTQGSGLGLYHVAQIIKDLKGTVEVNTEVDKGLEIVLEVQK
ncbi:sensor histidine kinase [Alkaliphilus transvaalensis]|uniref:sensor histidine kinase n=1 Tax=Alkaliphilus transvaalensis TaxID=114628 RepID=UPI00047D508D|nr:sensor histidine kinase [Alkaliphilus transvaalensis]